MYTFTQRNQQLCQNSQFHNSKPTCFAMRGINNDKNNDNNNNDHNNNDDHNMNNHNEPYNDNNPFCCTREGHPGGLLVGTHLGGQLSGHPLSSAQLSSGEFCATGDFKPLGGLPQGGLMAHSHIPLRHCLLNLPTNMPLVALGRPTGDNAPNEVDIKFALGRGDPSAAHKRLDE